MQARTYRYVLVAVLMAATFALSGCDKMLEPPRYAAEQATIGVDPSGETLDTSTVPPEDPSEQLVDKSRMPQSRPQPKPQPKDETQAQASPEPSPAPASPDTQPAPETGSNDGGTGSSGGGVSAMVVPPSGGSSGAAAAGMPEPPRRRHHLND